MPDLALEKSDSILQRRRRREDNAPVKQAKMDAPEGSGTADAVAAELVGHGTRQPVHGAFRRRVGGHVRALFPPRVGAHIDD